MIILSRRPRPAGSPVIMGRCTGFGRGWVVGPCRPTCQQVDGLPYSYPGIYHSNINGRS